MSKNRLAVPLCVGLAALLPGASALAANWPMFGQNVANTANNGDDTVISKTNVARLKPKWIATTGGDMSARPAVVGGVVYFPDWGGNLQALDAATGRVLWKYPSGGSVIAGAVVANGVVYWGSGYAHLGPPFKGNNKFYAFSIDGK